jgi:hypothetical protein
MEWQMPTLADVLEARRRISPHLRPTLLFGYAGLDELLGAADRGRRNGDVRDPRGAAPD